MAPAAILENGKICRKVMAAYRRVDDMVTCRLTACTPGSAPGPTLGIEYGKAFTFLLVIWITVQLGYFRTWLWKSGRIFYLPDANPVAQSSVKTLKELTIIIVGTV